MPGKFLITFLFVNLLCLAGCSNNIKEKYLGESRPNEFAIIKNKPLIIPNNLVLSKPSAEQEKNILDELQKENLSDSEKNIVSKITVIDSDTKIEKKRNTNSKPNILQRIF